jgi:hypothetical protein
MQMELTLILNQTKLQLLLFILKKSLQNPKNWSQDQTEGYIFIFK